MLTATSSNNNSVPRNYQEFVKISQQLYQERMNFNLDKFLPYPDHTRFVVKGEDRAAITQLRQEFANSPEVQQFIQVQVQNEIWDRIDKSGISYNAETFPLRSGITEEEKEAFRQKTQKLFLEHKKITGKLPSKASENSDPEKSLKDNLSTFLSSVSSHYPPSSSPSTGTRSSPNSSSTTPSIEPPSEQEKVPPMIAKGIPVELTYCKIQIFGISAKREQHFPVLKIPQAHKALDIYANKDFCWRPDSAYDEIPYVVLEEFQVSTTKAAQWLETLARDEGFFSPGSAFVANLSNIQNYSNFLPEAVNGVMNFWNRTTDTAGSVGEFLGKLTATPGGFQKVMNEYGEQFNQFARVMENMGTPQVTNNTNKNDPLEEVYTASEFYKEFCFWYRFPLLARPIKVANTADDGKIFSNDFQSFGGGSSELNEGKGIGGFIESKINFFREVAEFLGGTPGLIAKNIHAGSQIFANLQTFFSRKMGFTGYHPVRHFESGTNQPFTINFPLLNTQDLIRTINNYKFIYIFAFQNLITRTSSYSYLPPKYYKISAVDTSTGSLFGGPLQGVYIVSDFSANPIGQIRKIGQTEGLGTDIILPEGWDVSITFVPLLDISTNLLAQQFVPFSSNSNIQKNSAQINFVTVK